MADTLSYIKLFDEDYEIADAKLREEYSSTALLPLVNINKEATEEEINIIRESQDRNAWIECIMDPSEIYTFSWYLGDNPTEATQTDKETETYTLTRQYGKASLTTKTAMGNLVSTYLVSEDNIPTLNLNIISHYYNKYKIKDDTASEGYIYEDFYDDTTLPASSLIQTIAELYIPFSATKKDKFTEEITNISNFNIKYTSGSYDNGGTEQITETIQDVSYENGYLKITIDTYIKIEYKDAVNEADLLRNVTATTMPTITIADADSGITLVTISDINLIQTSYNA